MGGIGAVYEHFIRLQLTVVFTDSTFRTFSIVPALVRVATAEQQTQTPYRYENEPFFPALTLTKPDPAALKRTDPPDAPPCVRMG